MKNQEEDSIKEASRKEKLKADEAKTLAKDQARTKAYSAREQELEKAQKIKEKQRADARASAEAEELAKEKARKEAYQAREKIIAEDQEAIRQKAQKSTKE